MYLYLPTIAECVEFLRRINAGRAAVDLEPLELLDFDGAQPGSTVNCLAACNLFYEAGYTMGGVFVLPTMRFEPRRREVMKAVGAPEIEADGTASLPAAILVVTHPFDFELPGLRERMVEAGVV